MIEFVNHTGTVVQELRVDAGHSNQQWRLSSRGNATIRVRLRPGNGFEGHFAVLSGTSYSGEILPSVYVCLYVTACMDGWREELGMDEWVYKCSGR